MASLPPESHWVSLCECDVACGERLSAVFSSFAGDRFFVAKLDGGRTVCFSSHECGIGGVDCRAEKSAKHVPFAARAHCLPLVCTKGRSFTVHLSRHFVRARFDGQTASDYIAVSITAVGLLAVRTNAFRSQ